MKRRRRIGMAARARIRGGGPRAIGRPTASIDRWAQIKEQVVLRAGGCCQACGSRTRLDVHHVLKRAQGGSDFNLDLLAALCRRCHEQTDAPYITGRLIITPLGAGCFQFHIARTVGPAAEVQTVPTTLEAMRAVVAAGSRPASVPIEGRPVCPHRQTTVEHPGFAHVGKKHEGTPA